MTISKDSKSHKATEGFEKASEKRGITNMRIIWLLSL